jgi:hypothetical protein
MEREDRRDNSVILSALAALQRAVDSISTTLHKRIDDHSARYSDAHRDHEDRLRKVEEWKAGLRGQILMLTALGGVLAGLAEIAITRAFSH